MTTVDVLDPLIVAALTAGRRVTPAEAVTVRARHDAKQDRRRGPTCAGCRFRFRADAPECPSRVLLTTGSLRRALAIVPSGERRCRQCRQLVPSSHSGPLCDACQDQGALFELPRAPRTRRAGGAP